MSSDAPLAEATKTGEAIFLESPQDWVARYPDLVPLYSAPGGHITLAVDHSADTVGISIADTGQGILREKLPLIFEPFVQIDTTRGAHAGVGLGLAISRNLARGMGGDLLAESELGAGSKFTLTLPVSLAREKE